MKSLILYVQKSIVYNIRTFFLCAFFSCNLLESKLNAQLFESNGFGVTGGIHLNVGTHFNRIGFQVNAYYLNTFVQANTGFYGSFNAPWKAPKENHFEGQWYLGINFYWGQDSIDRYLINETGLNSDAPWGLGYYFTRYWDTRNTGQNSGGFNFYLHRFNLSTENDLFAGEGRDRFRTGALQLGFWYGDFYFSYMAQMWTGETRGAPRILPDETVYPGTGGYKDLSDSYLGKTSQGIAALRVNYRLPFAQNVRTEIGIDAEQIRHFFQNKLIHDPASTLERPNPHYPMLQKNGCPYLMNGENEIRKPYFYFQMGGNLPTFY